MFYDLFTICSCSVFVSLCFMIFMSFHDLFTRFSRSLRFLMIVHNFSRCVKNFMTFHDLFTTFHDCSRLLMFFHMFHVFLFLDFSWIWLVSALVSRFSALNENVPVIRFWTHLTYNTYLCFLRKFRFSIKIASKSRLNQV